MKLSYRQFNNRILCPRSHRQPQRTLPHSRTLTVLALESSADDTCAAIVTSTRKILANVVIKQHNLHEAYGGIHPSVAIEAHQRNMPHAIRKALDEARVTMSDIDGIAFTRGPGIFSCLSVCANAAKALSAAFNKPLVGVHHMQAHALTPHLTSPHPNTPAFPFLTLLVSGGHTLLLLASSPQKFKILATTRDESIGRAYDKVARILGLRWGERGPGAALEEFCRGTGEGMEGRGSNFGKEVEGLDFNMDGEARDLDGVSEGGPHSSSGSKEAPAQIYSQMTENNSLPLVLPVPRASTDGELFFSFSGLHSAVQRAVARRASLQSSVSSFTSAPASSALTHTFLSSSSSARLTIARAFQRAASAQLESRLVLGLRRCTQQGVSVREVVVSGGVASNAYIRDRLKMCLDQYSPDDPITLICPPRELCTDNAAMIAWASMDRFLAGSSDDYTILPRAKWSVEDIEDI